MRPVRGDCCRGKRLTPVVVDGGGSAVLAAIMLNERLELLGKIGCFLCLVGSPVIVVNAPSEVEVTSVSDITERMINNPGRRSAEGPTRPPSRSRRPPLRLSLPVLRWQASSFTPCWCCWPRPCSSFT